MADRRKTASYRKITAAVPYYWHKNSACPWSICHASDTGTVSACKTDVAYQARYSLCTKDSAPRIRHTKESRQCHETDTETAPSCKAYAANQTRNRPHEKKQRVPHQTPEEQERYHADNIRTVTYQTQRCPARKVLRSASVPQRQHQCRIADTDTIRSRKTYVTYQAQSGLCEKTKTTVSDTQKENGSAVSLTQKSRIWHRVSIAPRIGDAER